MGLIKNLNDLSKDDTSVAGGKGASLGEMIMAGINVPSGFVILANAFDKFLEETDLNVEIDSILHTVNHQEIHTIEHASEQIKSLILKSEISKNLATEILGSFDNLGVKYVAVRSSATAEDGYSASWAGQLDSYLNTKREDLLENIKKCWASLFTSRAIFYRLENNLHKQKISVAVVVQKMVDSDKSGIAFSVHPVTQDRNQLIIEAGFGLGEVIVSGQITPDSYVVEKQPRRIIDKNIQTQNPVLSDEEILELSELVIKIEKHFGFPCDIEWAFEGDKIFILQSRPITTLSSRPVVRKFQKFFTREIPLIVMEYWHRGEYKELYKILNHATHFNSLFIRNENGLTDVYYDMNNPDTALQPLFDYFKNSHNKFDLLIEEFQAKQKNISKLLDDFEFKSFSKLFNAIAEAWGYLPIWVQFGSADKKDILPNMIEMSYKLRDQFQEIEYKTGEVLLSAIKDRYPKLKDYAGVISAQEIINSKIPDFAELEQRKKGFVFFEEQVLIQISKEEFAKKYQITLVNDLATIGEFDIHQGIFEDKNLIYFGKRETDEFFARLRITGWTEFLEKEIGISYTTIIINSDGEMFFNAKEDEMIRSALGDKQPEDAWKYIDKIYQLKIELLTKKGKLDNKIIGGLSKMFAYFLIAKIICDNVYEGVSKEEKEKINRWRNDDPIFDTANNFNRQVDDKKEWTMIFKDGLLEAIDRKITSERDMNNHEEPYLIKGKTAYPGFVKGRVRLITSKDDLSTIQNGEILVTNMTTPEFVPALQKVAAFITDEGGITSHAAIVAREMKKPCIIGTKNATKKLKDGDLVEVDATKGVVRVLK